MAVNVHAASQIFRELRQQGGTAESLLANIENFVEAMQIATIPNKRAQESRQELTHGLRAGGAPGTHHEARAQVRELAYQYRQTAGLLDGAEHLKRAISTGNVSAQIDAVEFIAAGTKEAAANTSTSAAGRAAFDALDAQNAIITAGLAELKAAVARGDVAAQRTIMDRVAAATNAAQRIKVQELARNIADVRANVPSKLAILFTSGGPFLYPGIDGPASYAVLLAAGSKGRAVWHQLGLGPDKHPAYVFWAYNKEEVIDQQQAASSWVVAFYLVARP